jgi:predicted DCC family thiol-disulfide oxidoreductase YuxK
LQLPKYLLAYDAYCSVCTKFKRAVKFFDAGHQLDFLSIAESDRLGLLDAIPKHLRNKSFHLVYPRGELQSGSNAVLGLIRLLPAGEIPSTLISSAPGGRRIIGFVYSVLSRLHDAGACDVNHDQS